MSKDIRVRSAATGGLSFGPCVRLAAFALALCATACDDSRTTDAKMAISISGAIEKTVSGPANAGYASSWAGNGYSFSLYWAEDTVGRGVLLMADHNASPGFVFYSQQQPAVGVHHVTGFQGSTSKAEAITALMEGPHDATSWESDSGTVRIVMSRDRSLTLVGTFDVWLTCTQECPCKDKPCQVRVRGSMESP